MAYFNLKIFQNFVIIKYKIKEEIIMDNHDRREIENIIRFKKEFLKQQEELKGLTKAERTRRFIESLRTDKKGKNNE